MKERISTLNKQRRVSRRFLSLCFALASSLLSVMVESFVAVHPNATNYEEMSRRYDSKLASANTTFTHPDICNDVGPIKCQEMEDAFVVGARRLRKLTESTGKVKALVLLTRFSDHEDRPLPSYHQYDTLFNSLDHSSTFIPSGSIHENLDAQSYGQLSFEAHVEDWRTSNDTEEFWSFGKSAINARFRRSIDNILDEMDDEGFDFTEFDGDNDGYIDMIYILTSSYPAEIGDVDCYGQKHENRVWAHALADPGESLSWKSRKSGIGTWGYAVSSGMRGLCDTHPVGMSVLMHETGHLFGLPDLRSPDKDKSSDTYNEWVSWGSGHYDVMSDGHGRGGGSYPASFSPWSREFIGWLTDDHIQEITQDGLYLIESYQKTGNVYKISKGYPRGEYLLIENRRATDWDKHLFSGGILIWHIDETKAYIDQGDRGYPGQEGWPGNGRHHRVALLQADGQYDLEDGTSQGHQFDFWSSASLLEQLGPGPARDEAIPSEYHLYPNTDSYQHGNIKSTGIRLYDFSSTGNVMSFRVSGVSDETSNPTPQPTPRRTPSPTRPPTRNPTPGPTDSPTDSPTPGPTPRPTRRPTPGPTSSPTRGPTQSPTPDPTVRPTPGPSPRPSPEPTPRRGLPGLPDDTDLAPTSGIINDDSSANRETAPPAPVATWSPTGNIPGLSHNIPGLTHRSADSAALSLQHVGILSAGTSVVVMTTLSLLL